jgi:hypothetical protein
MDRDMQCDPHFEAPVLEFHLDYAQSSDFWSAVDSLNGASGSGSASSLESSLQSRYGVNEDAFSRVGLGLYNVNVGEENSLFHQFYFETNGEMVVWGVTQNPVVSQLLGKAVAMGSVGLGFNGRIPSTIFSTKMGVTAGLGEAKEVNGFSSNLIGSMPQVTESLQMYGIDLQVATTWESNPVIQGGSTLDYHGTAFVSDLNPTVMAGRWKSYSYLRTGGSSDGAELIFQPHVVIGPQPLPVDVLPRIWDDVHPLNSFQDLDAMLGAGAMIELAGAHHTKLSCTAGFYGGYWGGSLALQMGRFQVNAGSWGLGLDSNYQAEPERLWEGTLGWQF